MGTSARLLILVIGLGVLSGCDSNSGGDSSELTVTGTYSGSVDGTNGATSVQISILEGASDPFSGISISGDGSVSVSGAISSFSASGWYTHPVIQLDLTFGNQPPGTLNGQVREDRQQIDGTIFGPGVGGSIKLQKQ
ncbi:MAG: hypothetical protein KJO98_09685 [Rhodothermia bacterium]|nr:hypothetical protein [Rhodothermia bacterium]